MYSVPNLACSDTHAAMNSTAAALLQFMRQDDIHGVALFIQACLDRCYGAGPDPEGVQASDQP